MTDLTSALEATVGVKGHDPVAHLFAATALAVWRTAYSESMRSKSPAKVFAEIVHRGFAMLAQAAKGTPYG